MSLCRSIALLLSPSVRRSAVRVNDRDRGRQERPNFISGRGRPSCPSSLLSPLFPRGAHPIPFDNLMLGFVRKIGDIQGLFMEAVAVARRAWSQSVRSNPYYLGPHGRGLWSFGLFGPLFHSDIGLTKTATATVGAGCREFWPDHAAE